MISAEAAGTLVAAGIAGTTGIAAWLGNRRVRRVEANASATAASAAAAADLAELNRVQIESWKALIVTLRSEYAAVVADAALLREQLAECARQAERAATERGALRERAAVFEERIAVLRAAVTKLGGDVDLINRQGKEGPRGRKGATGDKGETGDRGETGDSG